MQEHDGAEGPIPATGRMGRGVARTTTDATGGIVLVVDDQPANLAVFEAMLTPRGYRVTPARSGFEALAIIPDLHPDVILLDVMMPGLDGLEVCRILKADPATALVPVIMVTALGARRHRLEGLAAGADDFLAKPIDEAELVLRVRSSVERSELQRRLHTTEAVVETIASAIELKDGTTGHHCRRLVGAANAFGQALGLPGSDLEILRWAGYLHDVGKVGVPDAVLTKAGPLTEAEWSLMRRHTELGEQMLRPLARLAPVLPIVRHHHEWWNGAGYPDGLAGERIPYLARVFQLVDAFDALVSARPYKPSLSSEAALEVMAGEAGSKFDPMLFGHFAETVWEGGIPGGGERSREALACA